MKEEDLGIDLANFSKEEEVERFEGMEALGWNIVVRLYTASKLTKGGIIIPDTSHDEQQYRNCVGLVVKKSKGVYLDSRYNHTGHWCKIGDWVVFPRHSGIKIVYDGLPTWVLSEDVPLIRVDDPSKVKR